jgi:TolA-binding protein
VVRSQDSEAGLRGRAQWLIGETHFLQQDFAGAIEAYRRVEGIDPGGMWVSASLIQAGKSFEQLGRTREAAVCYGNLLGRFANTPHADLARRRLAAISPDATPSNATPSKPTIRR